MNFPSAFDIATALVNIIEAVNEVFGPFDLECICLHLDSHSSLKIYRIENEEGLNLRIQQDAIIVTYWFRNRITKAYNIERQTLYLNKHSTLDQQALPYISKILR